MKNENFKSLNIAHNIILEGRERASISGVLDVESFDENEIIMETSKGSLTISGEGLRVEKLSIESGDTIVEGEIQSFEYCDSKAQKGSFWSKFF